MYCSRRSVLYECGVVPHKSAAPGPEPSSPFFVSSPPGGFTQFADLFLVSEFVNELVGRLGADTAE